MTLALDFPMEPGGLWVMGVEFHYADGRVAFQPMAVGPASMANAYEGGVMDVLVLSPDVVEVDAVIKPLIGGDM